MDTALPLKRTRAAGRDGSMQHIDVVSCEQVIAEAHRAFQNETSARAVDAVAQRLRATHPDHNLLILLEAKIVALLIGIEAKDDRQRAIRDGTKTVALSELEDANLR